MPEGDTIHRAAARLRPALVGREIARFELRRDPRGRRGPQPGAHVDTVEAHGKHLVISFDSGHVLHTHMQMTGVWHTYRIGERWRRPGHAARVVIETTDGWQAVCFSAPTVELREASRSAAPTRAGRALAALGPDLTTEAPDLEEVVARLSKVDPAREVGDVLLDQRVASGIGNVYKSEVCWALEVDPFSAIGSIDGVTRRALFERAHAMLRANVDRARRVTYQGGLAVYGKSGRPCPRCRNRIRSAAQGADLPRRTYWCPACQGITTTR